MKKNILKIVLITLISLVLLSCGKKEDKIKIVFLPNESNDSLKNSREEFAKVIEKATGKKVEIITTTDYNITMENIIYSGHQRSRFFSHSRSCYGRRNRTMFTRSNCLYTRCSSIRHAL